MAENSSKTASKRIDTMPDAQGQAELETAYQQNIAQGKAPYDGVAIKTYGSLLWVFGQRQRLGGDNFLINGQYPNLSGANLWNANLSGAALLRDLTEIT